jgi:L-threonylcarbamoyladenylate synthase
MPPISTTAMLPPRAFLEAAERLSRGELVAFPTETVYGLGARADDPGAVARVFEAKGRPRFNPLIAHFPDVEAAFPAAWFSPTAVKLAEAFWPGPMTLVLPRVEDGPVCALASAGLATVALRVPGHALAQAMLRGLDAPVVAPSANPSGTVSPTTAAHVVAGLDGRIDAVLDGGPCAIGIESTILAVEEDRVVLLRPGGVPVEEVEALIGGTVHRAAGADGILAPGMMHSHYAPGARLRLDADGPADGEAWLGFGADTVAPGPLAMSLSPNGDVVEAAASLFDALRRLDTALGHRGTIAVAPVPEAGLGMAINDRLRRAAAPR